ncbi:MAG: 4Fe-4S binding protein [Proteobacteria bacterium]|nr:4Fe-4S binding protein [Pseudomonadota bacterium]
MSDIKNDAPPIRHLMMGNEAIARGALEAGLRVAAGYPGTPSSEIIETLAKQASKHNLYVEWSVNEKVAMEVAASASFANIRSMCVLKQPGLNVAADFLLHLSGSGTRGGMVIVSADDPGALSSINEGETRPYAKLMEVPLLEPGDFQEAKDMTKWAFELSEKIKNVVILRTVTRLSHASGDIVMGEIPEFTGKVEFRHEGFIIDPMEGAVMSAPVEYKHTLQQQKLAQTVDIFESSPFNIYNGPDKPELLIITSSICSLYCREAVSLLNLEKRVGILKMGTTFPLPPQFMKRHLSLTDRIIFIEEVLPFLEDEVKILCAEMVKDIGIKTFYGKRDKTIPMVGEMNADITLKALADLMGMTYQGAPEDYKKKAQELSFMKTPGREPTFCPGCPHRASFFSIHEALKLDNRHGFVCGDIGCYSMAVLPCGFQSIKTLHAMGSGTGIASGFGQLKRFGMDQPVLSVCGDSTFFHAAMPALANAVHHQSNIVMVILDNSGTAMTGFQPHPGLKTSAEGSDAIGIDIPSVCRAMGAHVTICDPFDLESTKETLLNMMDENKGVNVLVLKQACALSPEKKQKQKYDMTIDESLCQGESCGCGRICTRIFCCPGLIWDKDAGKSKINPVTCAGCGVCASVCPKGAILKKEV